jgi:hypothetical protein
LKFRQPNGLHAHRHLHKIQYEANAEVFQTFSDVFQTLYDQGDNLSKSITFFTIQEKTSLLNAWFLCDTMI